MVNCNPETVSTDFDVLDKLYFEELTTERIRDILDKEKPAGIVVSVGGQIPNNLAKKLSQYTPILGTSVDSIDRAEDRSRFGSLLDSLGIEQPEWSRVVSLDQAMDFAEKIGYPVLIRPSYVLSGSAMNVAFDEEQLTDHIRKAAGISREYPVVVSKFLSRAREVEVDGVSDGSHVFIGAVLEHVENAGVHSGDATISIPTITIGESIRSTLLEYSRRIATALKIKGPFNIQFLVKNGRVLVIECNLRASRSMPFVSKATGTNLMEIAATAIINGTIQDGMGEMHDKFAIKAPQFSFMRLDNADPVTGVEMVSTGEVACFADTFEDALLNALLASNFQLPRPGDAVLISLGKTRKMIIPYARKLIENGYKLYATKHTGEELQNNGIKSTVLYKVWERKRPNILDYITNKTIKLVINIPTLEGKDEMSRRIAQDEYIIRRKATEYGIPLVTNIDLAVSLVDSLISYQQRHVSEKRTEMDKPFSAERSSREVKSVPPIAQR
jgi:carbamoyl-phosphate synthase large subunit